MGEGCTWADAVVDAGGAAAAGLDANLTAEETVLGYWRLAAPAAREATFEEELPMIEYRSSTRMEFKGREQLVTATLQKTQR